MKQLLIFEEKCASLMRSMYRGPKGELFLTDETFILALKDYSLCTE